MSEGSGFTRREFVGVAAAAVTAGSLELNPFYRRASAAAAAEAPPAKSSGAKGDIRPFKVNVPKAVLDDLKHRIKATKWPEKETVSDASQGVQLATAQALAQYWLTSHDWSKCQARLNSYPNFITEIDGLDIHFIHVKSKHENALPMLVTHGWPGSVAEQLKIIEPLTNPTAHGGTEADAFHLVIPSIPGYGFSGKPTAPGWDPVHIARAWIELMNRLGYKKYVAQGGDWGALITEQMAVIAPPELLAIHTNMPATVPDDVAKALSRGEPAPAGLSDGEKHAWDMLDFFYKKGLGYALEMANRPQTLYGLADSPVGLAAWMIDHDAASQALIARVFAGQSEGLTKDDILDNVTLYWATNTAVSSARLYWENKFAFFAVKGVKIPVAVSVFPDEIYEAPKSWVDRAYSRLIHFNRMEKGCHFAAWEQPKLFTDEMRLSFQSVR